MEMAFSIPMVGVIQHDWIAKARVRTERITHSLCCWIDFNLGASAQNEAGPLGSGDAWDA